jgi:hypothetical protein
LLSFRVFQVELADGEVIVAGKVVYSASRDAKFAKVDHRSGLASRHLDFDLSSEVDITTCSNSEVGATAAAEFLKMDIVLPAKVFKTLFSALLFNVQIRVGVGGEHG